MTDASKPILYQPLITALATLDIICPRCKHKSHSIVLDDIPDGDRPPGCAECNVCFPPAVAASKSSSSKAQPGPKRKKAARPTKTVDISSSSFRGDGVGRERPLVAPKLPDSSRGNAGSAAEIPAPLCGSTLAAPRKDDLNADDHVLPQPILVQPDKGSADFPNFTFFRGLKQKTRAEMSAELFEGPVPDEGSHKHSPQPPIESSHLTEPQTSSQAESWGVQPVGGLWSGMASSEARDNPTFAQEIVRSLKHPPRPSIVHNFEEDLAREQDARMKEG